MFRDPAEHTNGKDEERSADMLEDRNELTDTVVAEESGETPDSEDQPVIDPELFAKTDDDTGSKPQEAQIDEDDVLNGRVIRVEEDRQDIIVPEGPSKLDGEVLLVRRAEKAGEPEAAGLKVRRVKVEHPEDQGEEAHGFLYSFLDTLRFISLGLLVGILLVVFVVQRNDVYGESMEPTLHDGHVVIYLR